MKPTDITIEHVLGAYKSHKYCIVEAPHRLNIFGIRATGGMTNTFNDLIGALYLDQDHNWCLRAWQATTDPGMYWVKNPINAKGAAILQPQQLTDAFTLGLHRQRYVALVQSKPFRVWRDNNKNETYDFVSPESGMFGINLHYAEDASTGIIGTASAGCQVIADVNDFNQLMALVCKHVTWGWRPFFNYALFEEEKI